MEIVTSDKLSKLNSYMKTFKVKYSDIARQLNLDNSTVPKYFKGQTKMSVSRYNEILDILRKFAGQDELKLYLIETWLKTESGDDKNDALKQLSQELSILSSKLNEMAK